MKNYTNYLISNKFHLYTTIQNSLNPESLEYFDGTNVGSFSRLVNLCVANCPTEIVILTSDKMRPTADNVKKTLQLIDEGYAFVGLYRFGFFGFKKELFRRIGMMDERFVGGGYEDDDMYIRIKEADLSMYISHDVNYIPGNSSWSSDICKKHFLSKWGNVKKTGVAERKIEEEEHFYDLGKSIETEFLSWNYTTISAKKVKRYMNLKVL